MLKATDAAVIGVGFVIGASLFPQNASYGPTGLVGALAYWSAEAITTKFLELGALVPA